MKKTLKRPKWIWDKWQQEVLDYDGNITLRCGRQTGKSEVVAEKGSKFAIKNPGTTTMIIAAAQRQSSNLFEKIKFNIDREVKEGNAEYEEPPTLTKIFLKNGSRIYCLPAGRTGYYIRSFTIDLLIADEAAYINETVWTAITPMLAVSRKLRGMGHLILLSTPFGKGGYFYNSFRDKDFKHVHVSAEDCTRLDKKYLQKEKKRMTRAQYKQEYLAEFLDEWNQFFPSDLIKKCMKIQRWTYETDYKKTDRYYLGLDIARYGGDENAFVICELLGKTLKIINCFTTDRVSTTDTIGRVQELNNKYNFRKIFIDDSGVGGGVTDILQDRLGRKVLGLNNASKRVEIQGEERKKGILKEDLYSNVLLLMEQEKIELINDLDLARSLKSITFNYGEDESTVRRLRIFGSYTHLTEALVRACWCIKERGLNLFVY